MNKDFLAYPRARARKNKKKQDKNLPPVDESLHTAAAAQRGKGADASHRHRLGPWSWLRVDRRSGMGGCRMNSLVASMRF